MKNYTACTHAHHISVVFFCVPVWEIITKYCKTNKNQWTKRAENKTISVANGSGWACTAK